MNAYERNQHEFVATELILNFVYQISALFLLSNYQTFLRNERNLRITP